MIINTLRVVFLAVLCFGVIPGMCPGQAAGTVRPEHASPPLKFRWVFAFGYGRNTGDVGKVNALVDVAAAHGLNGLVLSSFGLESITRWDEKDIALLKQVADHCAAKGIELIPTAFSAGYGGEALGYNRSFAAALPATIALKAEGGKIVPAPAKNLLANGDLEDHAGNRFKGYAFIDQPGMISFADPLAGSGKTSIRFENFGADEHGHGRLMQKVAVEPGRTYRFSFRLKAENLHPVSGFKAMVLARGNSEVSLAPKLEPTQEWTTVTLDYINRDETNVGVYAGIWGGKSGKFWIDDLDFRQYGDLSDIVRREGTPLELRSRDREKRFEEEKDFEAIRCLRELPRLKIPPGSAVREGENLELACYKIPYVTHPWGRQISLCMSNPELYEYWEAQARKLHEVVPFKKFLLAMDEIRNGGGCLSCRQRGVSMAEILGYCVTRQCAMLRKIDPGIEVLIWSDMLDPAHNAHAGYYGVFGDFTGSWKYVPRDLSIMCWHHGIRDPSLKFFSGQGFRTYGAAYYDAADLAGSREWLVSLEKTPNAQGIMYTSWQKKYGLLADFGDLVSGAGETTPPGKE